jgi:hypothetical protein
MDDFIFSPKEKKDKTITEYYCMTGSEDFIDNDNNPRKKIDSKDVVAKRIQKTDNPTQYFIKISNANKLFNPLKSGLDDRSYSIVDNVCRPSDKFKTVNEKVFNMYLQFLSSKNISWLNQAERETI